jgi:hypothetical protein
MNCQFSSGKGTFVSAPNEGPATAAAPSNMIEAHLFI